ncbi:MAG: DUF4386 domain-containing protein [Phototrophicaceae bacterium]
MNSRRWIAIFLIIVPLAFNAVFFALGSTFNYPDILREPTDTILRQFAEGGDSLITLWYLFALTALLAIPLALMLYGIFAETTPQLSLVTTIVGVLSGLVQAFGLFRWTFLVPFLSTTYLDPSTDEATHAATVMVFEAAHRYLGIAVGEHMGYFFTGSWTILLSVMMFRTATFPNWLGWVGILSAVGVMMGLLEPAGWQPAGLINALSYIVWSLWLIGMGITLLLSRPTVQTS